MGSVALGVLEAGGEVVGVIIIPSMNTLSLAYDGLTRMDVPADMHACKARMHELADGYIAVPGGFGTFDELFETVIGAYTDGGIRVQTFLFRNPTIILYDDELL